MISFFLSFFISWFVRFRLSFESFTLILKLKLEKRNKEKTRKNKSKSDGIFFFFFRFFIFIWFLFWPGNKRMKSNKVINDYSKYKHLPTNIKGDLLLDDSFLTSNTKDDPRNNRTVRRFYIFFFRIIAAYKYNAMW